MELLFSHTLIVSPDTLVNFTGEEAVLLNLKTETYYGLDDVGTDMWKALTSTESIQSAYDRLLAEYDVAPAALEKDLREFIDRLLGLGLLSLA